jgi:hypothetical protein
MDRAGISRQPYDLKEMGMNTPEGWKLVPVEPTKEMLIAARLGLKESKGIREMADKWQQEKYAAMLAAAPTPPACTECNDTGEIDSGGTMPWGEPAMVRCYKCNPTPPAQEDEPVYQLRFDGNTWFDTPKEQYDYFTSKEREVKSDARILYTHPANDELRRAAEEAVSRFDQYMLEESRLPDLITAIGNLRAALEK